MLKMDNFVGSMAGAAMTYGLTGNATFVNAGFVFPLLSGDDFPVSDKKNYSKPTAPTFRRSFIL